jgi:hypothetical protein
MAYLNEDAGKAREGQQAAAVADIPTPASATATECANKINALLAALRAAGLLKSS